MRWVERLAAIAVVLGGLVSGPGMIAVPVAADCGMGPPPQHAAGYRGIAFIGTVAGSEPGPHHTTVLTMDVERPILGVDSPTLTIVSDTKGCSYFWGGQLKVGDRFLLAYRPVQGMPFELPEGATYADSALAYRPTADGWRFARSLSLYPEAFPGRAQKADTLAEILAFLGAGLPPTNAEPSPLPSPVVALSARGEAQDDLFRLTIEAPGTTFMAGEPIPVTTTLAFVAPAPSVTIRYPGTEVVGYTIEKLDGTFEAETGPGPECGRVVFEADEARTVTFGQSDPHEPDPLLWSPFVDDDLAGLDPGAYRIDARAAYGLSGCQRPTELTASVTIEVVDAELGPDASPVVVVIPTSDPVPSGGIQVCQTAQLLGSLASDGRWGVALLSSPVGRTVKVIWPNGWSGRRDSTGLALLDATGAVVAREGDEVELGGGYDEDDHFRMCGDPGLVLLP